MRPFRAQQFPIMRMMKTMQTTQMMRTQKTREVKSIRIAHRAPYTNTPFSHLTMTSPHTTLHHHPW
jgi:hypothetical protein